MKYFQENLALSKIKHFVNLRARKLFSHAHIQSITDYGLTLWDSASANTLKLLVGLHKRALKAILLKTTTLVISDHNFLSILPLKVTLIIIAGGLGCTGMAGHKTPSYNCYPPERKT